MDYEQRKAALRFALISRVLTDAEMAEVEDHDFSLMVDDGVPYMETEKRQQFNDALLQQFKLRMAAAAVSPKDEQ